jgi:hypothetical protein
MTKKLSVVAMSLFATMLLTTSVFAANNCSGGTNPVFIGVGSSAQTNSLAYAAVNITTAGSFSGYEIWTTSSAQLQDTRFSPAPIDKGLTLWVVWTDNASNPTVCDVYAYFQEDSTVGVRDFFSVAKSVSPGKGVYHAVFAVNTNLTAVGGNKIPGLTDSGNSGFLPSQIITLLTTSPAPTSATQAPLPHCGQLGVIATTTVYCFFNMGGTDIRPEDALFATTRALSAYSTTNGLAGLGYDQIGTSGCGAVDTNEGCVITDSFAQGKAFNVLNFKISGTDPKTGATIPASETLSTGIAPVVVLVSNADTGSLGFGSKYTDSKSVSHYVFTNINRKVLANILDGTLSCTGTLLPGLPASGNNVYDQGFLGGPPPGTGQPIQVVHREPLSGTYNTMEFGGVRTLTGSLATGVKESAISATQWLSDDNSGQELDNNPSDGFGTTACSATTGPTGSTSCGDPMWRKTPSHASITNASCPGSGQDLPIRVRGIGTGNAVAGVLGTFNATTGGLSPGWKVTDGMGYAFWSYQNFKAANATGTTPGHYLTVDSIDPLFITAGGEFDSSYGPANLNNPSGAFNPPQCPGVNGGSFPCQQIPFTHINDGTYPIWSLLRQVTFKAVSGKQAVPAGVIAMNANAQIEAVDNRFNLSDFAPLLKNINLTTNKGDLNIGVFRSHYKQTNSPNNGNAACAGVFTGISIAASSGCLIDAGGDVGGSVLTIESDDSFNKDFGSLFLSGKYEIYSLRQ